MAIDPLAEARYGQRPTMSPRGAEAVDISAGDHALTAIPTALYVGGTGILYAPLADESGTFHTYANIANGTLLPGQWHTIRSDTTATQMVALRP